MLRELEQTAERAVCAAGTCPEVNVGESERTLSILAGTGLLVAGVLRGRLLGAAAVLAGGCLAYRGLTGHCSIYESLGISTSK